MIEGGWKWSYTAEVQDFIWLPDFQVSNKIINKIINMSQDLTKDIFCRSHSHAKSSI
jgi:hypothetical protein